MTTEVAQSNTNSNFDQAASSIEPDSLGSAEGSSRTLNPPLFASEQFQTAPSSPSFVLPSSPTFWDILFAVRHSLSSNAFAVSVFMDVFNLFQLVIVVSVLYISQEDFCDIPLRNLLYFYSSRIVFSLVLASFFLLNRKYHLVGPLIIRTLDFIRLGIDILTIAIIVCGNYLVFIKNTCQFSSPALFYTSFGLIVINYLTIAFPIFLMITLLMSGRFRSFPGGSVLHMEAGVPQEALEKTKLVRVRYNVKEAVVAPPGPLVVPVNNATPIDLSESKQPLSPSISIFTTVSAHGTSVLVVPPGSCQECSICLSQFEENDLVRKLTCQHHFHGSCIDRWLENHQTCPLCKHDLTLDIDPNFAANSNFSPRTVYLPREPFLSLTPNIS